MNQQVSWWSVHEFVAGFLDAARHWALHVEMAQEAECEASRAISAAYDWAAISCSIRRYAEFHAEKPWMKRKPA